MRSSLFLIVTAILALFACGAPTTPTALPTARQSPSGSAPIPPPSFPSIEVGQAVRFRFMADDDECVGGGGRCRSYQVTAPANGLLEAVLTSVSGDAAFTGTTEMYLVPGADFWTVGPGPRLSVDGPATAKQIYEIRMFSGTVPSTELELRVTLHPTNP